MVERNLESNNFSGLSPQDLWEFPNLSTWKLGNNTFSGPPNSTTGVSASLQKLGLHSNFFSGRLLPSSRIASREFY
ncbi:hypothetical protein R1flu_016026 [Riccia fluitans]|uniref:Uncharacterized protein n=1 Tax=Riccia fluitans TaxID=41844 RepID=A0ABD1YKW6_9MARC